MSISRQSKARASSRILQTTRPVLRSDVEDVYDEFGNRTGKTYVNQWIEHIPVYTKPTPPTSKRKHKFSKRKLRNRLYRKGVRGTVLVELISRYANHALIYPSDGPTLKEEHRYAIWKALTSGMFWMHMFFDEYHSYAGGGFAKLVEAARSAGVITTLVTQRLEPTMMRVGEIDITKVLPLLKTV